MLIVAVMGGVAATAFEQLHQARSVTEWISTTPMAWVLTMFIAVLAGCSLLVLFGRAAPATLTLIGLLGVFHVAHAAKVANTGKPLFPWDVFLFREGLTLVGYATARHGTWVVGTTGAVLLLGIALGWWKTRPIATSARLALLGMVIAGWVVVASKPQRHAASLGVQHMQWVPSENSHVNGALLAFTLNGPMAAVSAPAGYTREKVRGVVAGLDHAPSTAESPSVIVVMSESFFDPTTLPGIVFEEDPLPTLRRLQRTSAWGTLFPPVFGGGTANTEFEFLTSYATRFLPAGSVPYQQYVRRELRSSLPHLFANAGYRTSAIHTFYRWFWEREQVYQHLGFTHFLGLEDMPGLLYDGVYPSDAELTKRIIEEVERSDQPLFLFAVSMEAHGPYQAGRYPTRSARFSAPLDERARGVFASYVEAISHADRELGKVIDYFERTGKPAIVVFFGDHQPALDEVYQQLGLIKPMEQVDELRVSRREKFYQVPIVMWTNATTLPQELGRISPVFIGPLLLKLTGTEGTRYTDFVSSARQQAPVMLPGMVSDSSGTLEEVPADGIEALEDAWWTLQYDGMFGDDFLKEEERLGG